MALAPRYNGLRDLFKLKFRLEDATAVDVVQELENVKCHVEHVDLIKELLIALNSLIPTDADGAKTVRTLKKFAKKIMPVKGSKERLQSTEKDEVWFIADRPRLEECFTDSVALLDFNHEEISKLKPLFNKPGVEWRYLSKTFTEETVALGDLVFHQAFTDSLRSKATFISG